MLTTMSSTEPRLFAPGDGATPPELAGRDAQQAVLSRCLGDLVRGAAPPHNVVLVGPRGNGKTVLLNWFKAACMDANSVEVLALTPRDIPAPQALMDALLPRRGLAKLLPRKVGIASVGLGEGLLGVGRLTEAAARDALVKPFARHDVAIDPEALAAVTENNQHYPYFIQLWGDALWQEHLANPNARLTTAASAAMQGAVAVRVAEYYEGRYQELAADGLLSAAAAVAPLFQGSTDGTASNQAIDGALVAAGIEDAADRFAACEGLNRLSYMWRPPGQLPPVLWSVGIPSPTTYILEHAPESATR